MNDHIIFLTETERVRVEFRDGEVELGRTQINLATERQLVEGVIAALCSAFGVNADCFETKIVIRQLPDQPKLGTVSLAVKLGRTADASLDGQAVARFCTEELVKQMDVVVRTTEALAECPYPPVKPLDEESVASSVNTADSDSTGETRVDLGEVARRTLAEELLKRLPGKKAITQIAISSGSTRYDFSAGIPFPKRREETKTVLVVIGYVNALHRRSSQIEIYAEVNGDGTKDVRMPMMYRTDGSGAVLGELATLLQHPASVKIRFDIDRVVDYGPGGERFKDTLRSWNVLSSSSLSSESEPGQTSVNHAPLQTSTMALPIAAP